MRFYLKNCEAFLIICRIINIVARTKELVNLYAPKILKTLQIYMIKNRKRLSGWQWSGKNADEKAVKYHYFVKRN